MTESTRFQLKHPTGWFAAGREVACALEMLSDSTFKLFVWLCLHAERHYMAEVKRLFLERRYVQSGFTAADEKLALLLFRRGVSLIHVEHAILLGAVRKYIAVHENGNRTPISSLHYFTDLFEEVQQETSTHYWTYIARKVKTFEQTELWDIPGRQRGQNQGCCGSTEPAIVSLKRS